MNEDNVVINKYSFSEMVTLKDGRDIWYFLVNGKENEDYFVIRQIDSDTVDVFNVKLQKTVGYFNYVSAAQIGLIEIYKEDNNLPLEEGWVAKEFLNKEYFLTDMRVWNNASVHVKYSRLIYNGEVKNNFVIVEAEKMHMVHGTTIKEEPTYETKIYYDGKIQDQSSFITLEESFNFLKNQHQTYLQLTLGSVK